VIYDWGGGLIWAALPPSADAQAAQLRKLVNAAGGHATLIRAPEDVRRAVDVFHPQPKGIAALGERVRTVSIRRPFSIAAGCRVALVLERLAT
jgi:glycolate oxidase FAD binding subunit